MSSNPQRRRPVMFFLTSLSGGTGVVVARLCAEFESRGIAVCIVAEKAAAITSPGLPPTVEFVVTGRATRPRGFARLARALWRIRPQHIVCNDRRSTVAAIRVTTVARLAIPVSAIIHDTYAVALRLKPESERRTQARQYRTYYPRLDRIVAVSRGAARAFASLTGISPGRVEVVYDPVPSREQLGAKTVAPGHRWFGAGETVPVIVSSGRLQRDQKDFSTLLRAFHRLRRQREVRLILIGDGKDRPRLERVVDELGIGRHVDMPGWVPEPYGYYRAAAVFAHCSVHEGFGLAIAEALACGARVVAADCPHGPREILRDGELGWLFPAGDDAAMTMALATALDSPAPPDEAVQAHLRRFRVESVADRYLEILGIG